MQQTQNKNMIFKQLANAIIEHPGVSGLLSSITTGLIAMINIPESTEIAEFIGVVIKDIGILAGSSVAVASCFSYLSKRKAEKKNRDGNNSQNS